MASCEDDCKKRKKSASKQNKRYANFDFKQEKETGSLLSIPYTWVRSHKKSVLESRNELSSLDAQNTYAFWPAPNTSDERNVRSLIMRCSEPNVETWVKLPGKLKGVFDSLAEAEEALELLSGEAATESEAERLASVGKAIARKKSNIVAMKTQPSSAKRKLNTATNVNEIDTGVPSKSTKTSARVKIPPAVTAGKSVPEKSVQSAALQLSSQFSKSSAVTVPPETFGETSTMSVVQPAAQLNSDSQSTLEQTSSTSVIPVTVQSCGTVSTITDQSLQAQSDARLKLVALCRRTVNIPPPVLRLSCQQLSDHSGSAAVGSDGVMDALNIINRNVTAYMTAYSDMSHIFEQRLTALHEHLLAVSAVVTEIADGFAERRAAVALSSASPQRVTLPVLGRLKKHALTTPKDIINAMGFPVETTPEDLVAMETSFCELDNSEHKQRRSSLKAALIKSLPKPDGMKTVTAITTARGALLQLADYALWQFFCGSGCSGSAKLNMSLNMPVIYNIILVVVQKIMNVTEKEAATALSTSLKNAKNRSSARKYIINMEKLRRATSTPEDAESPIGHNDNDAAESAGDQLSGEEDELAGSTTFEDDPETDNSSVEPSSSDEGND